MRGRIALLMIAMTLSACTGSQTMKGLNAFNSDPKESPWNSDYSGYYSTDSFWYSGYSDKQIHDGGASGSPDSGGGGHSDSGGM